MEQTYTREQAEQDVHIMAERLAMLYYYFVKQAAERYGEDEALSLARAVVDEYGTECGRLTRSRVEEQGLAATLANHHAGKDLPGCGWRTELLRNEPTAKVIKTTYCPLAKTWQRYACEQWGRVYCWVDQAKFGGYSKDITCITEQNVLDGDDCCLLRMEENRRF